MDNLELYQDEASLMRDFRAGNQQAFAHVYKQLYERLYWYGRRFIEDEPDVEDMIADSYIQVWNRRQEFGSVDSVAAFLHVAVRNQCFNLLKRRQMKAEHHAELLHLLEEQQAGDFSIEQLQATLMKKILAQVGQLPEKTREVFLLSYQEGLKPAEIAERLHVSVQTVKNQKVTALKVLKLALANEPLLLAMLTVLQQEGRWLT